MFVVISAQTEKKTWKDWSCCLSDPRLCSFSYQPKEELMLVCPGIPEDNDCSFTPRFVMLLLSGRRLSFVIEAGRMAMACT